MLADADHDTGWDHYSIAMAQVPPHPADKLAVGQIPPLPVKKMQDYNYCIYLNVYFNNNNNNKM